MIVIDASVVVELLLNSPFGTEAARRVREAGATLHAPNLLDLEVASVLRRAERLGEVPPDRARLCIQNLAQLRIERHPHVPFLGRIWDLRPNLTPYDAAYIALAESLDAPLMTLDARMAGAPHRARVEVIRAPEA